jgi:hypothetical protein
MGQLAVGANREALTVGADDESHISDVRAVRIGDSGDRPLEATEQAHLIGGAARPATPARSASTSHGTTIRARPPARAALAWTAPASSIIGDGGRSPRFDPVVDAQAQAPRARRCWLQRLEVSADSPVTVADLVGVDVDGLTVREDDQRRHPLPMCSPPPRRRLPKTWRMR